MAGIPEKGTVLVTGATGFVGSAVTRTLLAQDCEVIGLVRSTAGAAAVTAAGARVALGDMLDPDSYRRIVHDVDAVVHAAQLRVGGRVTARRLASMNRANSLMTGTLAEACLAAGKRFVYTGGSFVYGDHGTSWINEDTPLTPSPLGEGDAREITRLRELHRRGLDVVVICPGFVYGPGGNFKKAFYDPGRKGRFLCIGRGENYWSCVHVDDLASAYAAALFRAAPGQEFNVVDDSPLTLRSIVDQLAAVMGGRKVSCVPPWVVALAAGRPAVASLTTSYRVDNGRARDDLGWTPRYSTLAEGLAPTLTALERAA